MTTEETEPFPNFMDAAKTALYAGEYTEALAYALTCIAEVMERQEWRQMQSEITAENMHEETPST